MNLSFATGILQLILIHIWFCEHFSYFKIPFLCKLCILANLVPHDTQLSLSLSIYQLLTDQGFKLTATSSEKGF